MATDRRQLNNVVARLVSQGRNTRYIFTYLKQDSKFRNVRNDTITKSIEKYRLAFSRGRAANTLGAKDDIGKVFAKDRKKRPGRICVDYEFKHAANGKNERGSNSNSKELNSIEVSSDATMKEIKDEIMGTIRAWLDKHYQVSNIRSIRSSLKITSIQEC
jgi:hypothetical protein